MKKISKSIIKKISRRSLKQNKTSNIIAIIAIAITMTLFVTVFSSALSFDKLMNDIDLQRAGGYQHVNFEKLTEEEYQTISNEDSIQSYGKIVNVGILKDAPFNKHLVSVSHIDNQSAKFTFQQVETGANPKEGTNEVLVNRKVLQVLGLEEKIGQEFTVKVYRPEMDVYIEETFIVSGFLKDNEYSTINNIIVTESKAKEMNKYLIKQMSEYLEADASNFDNNILMPVFFKNDEDVEYEAHNTLKSAGYQGEDKQASNYISFGVNWVYENQDASSDTTSIIALLIALVVIIFAMGYLIIYNIFKISVVKSIQFYGMLKTVGMSPKQIKKIIRIQSQTLCLIAIPIGALLGFILSYFAFPKIIVIIGIASSAKAVLNPLVYLIAIVFTIITIFISTNRAAKVASKVSPMEALRYTESFESKKKRKKTKSITPLNMAIANVGRSKVKSMLIVLSIVLSLVILNVSYNFANSFDEDKYTSTFAVDFLISDVTYTNPNEFWNEQTVDEETISYIENINGFEEGGRTYSHFVAEYINREAYDKLHKYDQNAGFTSSPNPNSEGLYRNTVNLYGMDSFAQSNLKVYDGNLEKLGDTSKNYIVAIYDMNDAKDINDYSHWANVGDSVKIEFYDRKENGELIEGSVRVEEFEVIATAGVLVPHSMRFSDYNAYLLDSSKFTNYVGDKSSIMHYTFNVEDDSLNKVDVILEEYTTTNRTDYDYESILKYQDEIRNVKLAINLVGFGLSIIIGFVGILNFLNSTIASIIARKREFATLQSVGMTGRQLKKIIAIEGVIIAIIATLISIVIVLLLTPVMTSLLENLEYLNYQSNFIPLIIVSLVLVVLTMIIPIIGYRSIVKQSIVERLRNN